MMTYADLSLLERRLLMLWVAGLVFIYVFNTARSLQLKRGFLYSFHTAAAVAVFYYIYNILGRIDDAVLEGTESVYIIPISWLLAALLFFTVYSLYLIVAVNRWKKNNISGLSIKESFDSLPTALCFFLQSGVPRMTNKEMEKIVHELCGEELSDAGRFWLSLKYGERDGCIIAGNDPIYQLPDGRIFSFSLREMTVEKNKIYELIGNNITEEYRLNEELKEKSTEARWINERLRTLNKSITRITAEKEVLAAKIKIHNEFGNLLLYSKSYLAGKADIDRKKLLTMWRNNNRLFEEAGPEVWQSTYSSAVEDAERLGVKVVTNGQLPENALLKDILETAIKVQVNNTLRHAHGHTVYASYSIEGGKYVIVFENDGNAPTEEIREGGGIGNLRRMVERTGGSLVLSQEPQFSMKLEIPMEVQ